MFALAVWNPLNFNYYFLMAKSKKNSAKKSIFIDKLHPSNPAPEPDDLASEKPVANVSFPATNLKRRVLEHKPTGPAKSIFFSFDEVREIIAKNEKQAKTLKTVKNGAKPAVLSNKLAEAAKLNKPAKPNHVKAASLNDILGFNPKKGPKPPIEIDKNEVPEKLRSYYCLLLDLRSHVLAQLGEHTEETLLKSAKDDSGDLSGYGQHMADAGTDTFDRDFALSLVSSEQEALSEIEAAIKRIHNGAYGICEITKKRISNERLLAVPFTRYSAEAQKEVERHSHRTIQRGGLFGNAGEEEGGIKVSDEDNDDE